MLHRVLMFLITLIIIKQFSCTATLTTTDTTSRDDGRSEPLLELLTETTTSINEIQHSPDALIDMEIIGINVPLQLGNVIELFWGKPIREYNLNWTYGVYYGSDLSEALETPQVTTKELNAIVSDLEFCKKYFFGVGVVNENHKTAHSSKNIRSIVTSINSKAPPQNLRVEFLPDEYPCLLIKWSASCANVNLPLGYLVTLFERQSSHLTIVTIPPSIKSDLTYGLRISYGNIYDVKVCTDIPGSQFTETITYKAPFFLQPHNVRLTSLPNETYLIYWHEPYVPYYVGAYYYEVYVYMGRNLTNKPEYVTQVNRAALVYKGNGSEYTFMVGLVSCDGNFKSPLSDPLSKSIQVESIVLDSLQ